MRRWPRKQLCLLALLLWLPQGAVAADSPPAAERVTAEAGAATADVVEWRDPAALAELSRATDFLAALPRFHIRASAAYDVIQEDGRRLQFEKHGDIYLQRPDRLFAEVHRDDGAWHQLWYDGERLTFAELSKSVHARVTAPPTVDATLDMLEELLQEPLPLADLLYSDLSPLAQRAVEADIVGPSLVNGRTCQHLAFRGQTVDWQVWIEQGATPFIRKLAITYRDEPGTPQYVAAIDLWETPERFGDDRFAFVVPEGSQAIGVLVPRPRRIEQGGRP